jgi:GT2 family glycosyltransferase
VIGVVVVYYRAGYATLRATVDAVLGESPVSPERLVIVDSASGDNCVAAVCADTGTRALTLPTNRGFAAAVRAGLEALSPDLDPVLVLTHECVVAPGCVQRLMATMTEGVGIAAPRLTLPDGRAWSDGGRFGSIWRRPRHETVALFDRRVVDWVDGAAMLCRRSVVEALPVDYGMYFEDVELGWICRRRGLRVVVAGDATATQDTRGMAPYDVGRGWVMLQRRARGPVAAALTTLTVGAMAAVRLAQRRPQDAGGLFRGASAGWRSADPTVERPSVE